MFTQIKPVLCTQFVLHIVYCGEGVTFVAIYLLVTITVLLYTKPERSKNPNTHHVFCISGHFCWWLP